MFLLFALVSSLFIVITESIVCMDQHDKYLLLQSYLLIRSYKII